MGGGGGGQRRGCRAPGDRCGLLSISRIGRYVLCSFDVGRVGSWRMTPILRGPRTALVRTEPGWPCWAEAGGAFGVGWALRLSRAGTAEGRNLVLSGSGGQPFGDVGVAGPGSVRVEPVPPTSEPRAPGVWSVLVLGLRCFGDQCWRLGFTGSTAQGVAPGPHWPLSLSGWPGSFSTL